MSSRLSKFLGEKKKVDLLKEVKKKARENARRKKIPFYIVKQINNNGTLYRIHDIYYCFNWSGQPTLQGAFKRIAKYMVFENMTCQSEFYKLLDYKKSNGDLFVNKYLHYDDWVNSFISKGNEVPLNNVQEYKDLLANEGTYTYQQYYHSRFPLLKAELIDFDIMKRGVERQCRVIQAHKSFFEKKKRRKKHGKELKEMLLSREVPVDSL
jgi:hypothetical protein